MVFSSDKEVEDRIVEIIASSKSTVKSLHSKISAEMAVSLRAVYKAVNKLIGAGVMLKVGKHILLDQEWMARVGEALVAVPAISLASGERAAYTFVSIDHLDAFWKTTVLPLENSLSAPETLFYNPHNFWAYLPSRKESEDAYYRRFQGKRYGFFTVGGSAIADAEFKRTYQTDQFQVDLREVGVFRRTDHVTLLGTFIITVRLSKTVADRIDGLYAREETMETMLHELVRICEKPGKIRFLIENNPAKSEKLKRVLSKNFYFRSLA